MAADFDAERMHAELEYYKKVTANATVRFFPFEWYIEKILVVTKGLCHSVGTQCVPRAVLDCPSS